MVVRAVAEHGNLIPDLHERRPDVIPELDLHHGLERAAHAQPECRPDDAGLGQRRIEDTVVAEPSQQDRALR